VGRISLRLLYFSGGYTTHDRRFLEAFVASGFEVNYLRLLDQRLDCRNLPDGVTALSWVGDTLGLHEFSDYYQRFAALRQILNDLRPDAVVAGPVQTSAFLVALTQYRPVITMSWGSDLLVYADQSSRMMARTRYTLNSSSGVLGDCDAVRKKVHSLTDISDERIVTFPWGIDLQQFTPDPNPSVIRESLGWEQNSVLISTRSWEPLYRIDVLVNAFAILHQTNPKSRLILLGDGSESKKVLRLISELGLEDLIHAPGRIGYESLSAYFRSADLYVSSALSDGTSISLLEAMATGLPVVVTDSYGNREWVTNGKNGWLASPDNALALGEVLKEALSDSDRLQRIKELNIELAREKADWNNNFPKLVTLIRQVVK